MNSTLLAVITVLVLSLLIIAFVARRMSDQAAHTKNLGQVDFKTMKAKIPGNFLSLPEGFCSHIDADFTAPSYSSNAEGTRQAFRKIALSLDHLERIHVNDAALRERYLLRGSLLRMPCILQVEFVDIGRGSSSIAICSTPLIRFPIVSFALTNPGRPAVMSLLKELEKHLGSIDTKENAKTPSIQKTIKSGSTAPEALANG